MKKERIEFLDAIKAVSILLVVYCHFITLSKETVTGNFFMSVAWCAVPCFMMTTGAVLHQKNEFSWSKYIRQLIRTYIIVCIWRLIYLLVFYQIAEFHYGKRETVQYLFMFNDLDAVNTGLMWYMIAYIVVMCLYPVTYQLFRMHERKTLAFMMGLAFLSGIMVPSVNWALTKFHDKFQLPVVTFEGLNKMLPFLNYGNMIFYFILGAFLFEYKEQILSKIKRWILFPLIIVSGFCIMLVKYADTGEIAWAGKYLTGGYTHISVMICSLAIWLALYAYADDHKKLHHFLSKYIGQHTMGIFYLHYILLAIISVTMFPLIKSRYSFGMNCIKTIFVTAVCVVLTKIMKKIPAIKMLVK